MKGVNMAHEFEHPIIGQEAICPDGLGRVIAFQDAFPFQWIKVSTYVNDRQCEWAPHNVELIDPPNLELRNHTAPFFLAITFLAVMHGFFCARRTRIIGPLRMARIVCFLALWP